MPLVRIKPTKQQCVDFLNLLTVANVTYDIAERLQNSPFDVKAIKMHINGFKKAVEHHNKFTNELFAIDAKASQIAYNNAHDYITKAFKLDPVDWQYLEGLRKLLEENPNDTKTVQIKALIQNATS